MIEGDRRLDTRLQQGIDDIVVIIDTFLVDVLCCTVRKNSRPTERETVCVTLEKMRKYFNCILNTMLIVY